jgi:hypothetical protein
VLFRSRSTCFGHIPCPSSGAQLAVLTASGVDTHRLSTPDAVSTVNWAPDDGHGICPKHVERLTGSNKVLYSVISLEFFETYEKMLLYFHNVLIYILECIYVTLNIVCFLNILFRYNTLFTYINKNILLIIGIVFSVSLGPYEHLQVFERPVPLWSVISKDLLTTSRWLGTFDSR